MGDLVTMPAWQPIVCVLKPQSWVPVLLALSDCRTVRRTVGLSDCRKDCRTVGLAADSGRQCESVSPWTYCRTTVGMTVGMTVGLSDTVGILSDTVGRTCRTVGPGLKRLRWLPHPGEVGRDVRSTCIILCYVCALQDTLCYSHSLTSDSDSQSEPKRLGKRSSTVRGFHVRGP